MSDSLGSYLRSHKAAAVIGAVVGLLLIVVLAAAIVLNSNLLRPTLDRKSVV